MEAGQPDEARGSEANGLGPRLRAIRLARGIGVRELARRLDVSPSAISQIETGKIQPSVRTLYALAAEFGVSMNEALFDEGGARLDSGAQAGAEPAGASPPPPGLVVQRADGRRAITLSSGVRWERLMVWADDDTEFLEATYEPGGASSPNDAFVRHSGHEFGLVLSGTLHVTVGFDEYVLNPGDSITFPSSTPHRLSNDGTETVRAVWVVRGRRGETPPPAPALDAGEHHH
jgi:transcriptional regulator with XRE-family HTH domain